MESLTEIKVMHPLSTFNLAIVFCFSGATTLALGDNNLNEIFQIFK